MKRKINYILVFTILTSIILMGCASSSKAYSEQDINELGKLVEGKKFEIESDWAYPLASNALNSITSTGLLTPGSSASQISLIGNANYLKITGDSIKAKLPYYGERQVSGNYNSRDVGIVLNGLIKDVEVVFNEKKNRYRMRFDANEGTENYQVTINIFPNKEVYMNINSSQRSSIAYRGDVKVVE